LTLAQLVPQSRARLRPRLEEEAADLSTLGIGWWRAPQIR